MGEYHFRLRAAAALFILFIAAVFHYLYWDRRIAVDDEARLMSLQFVEALRHEVNDLSRLAQAYEATGETRYFQLYENVVSAREGRRPRFAAGTPMAHQDATRQTGLVAGEMNLLADIEARAAAQIAIERNAMHQTAIGKSGLRDTPADLQHDAVYRHLRLDLAERIDGLEKRVEQRMIDELATAGAGARFAMLLLLLTGASAAVLLLLAYRSLHSVVGGSLDDLRGHILKLSRGDYSASIDVPSGMEGSIFGWLAGMQERQRSMDREREEAEVRLAEREARLRTIIENEPECIKIVGPDGGLREMNPAGLAMIEADGLQSVQGCSVFGLIAPEYRDEFVRMHRQVIAGEPRIFEFEVLGIKGTRRWMETHAVPMRDGKEMVHLAVTRDISERKRAEIDLRIAAVAFESNESMMVMDARKQVLRVNRAFIETTGYAPEDIVGMTPDKLTTNRHGPEFYEAVWQNVVRDGGWQGEVWERHKDGKDYPKWLTVSAVRNAGGKITHYICSRLDISERKRAEERINALAFYDQLTGLANRTLLLDRLRLTQIASMRSQEHGALIFVDLDNFKTLNDTKGHARGDQLLKEAAARLTECVRAEDTAARLGGDEFVVVLSRLGCNQDDAARAGELVAEKIRDALARPYFLEGAEYNGSASIGVTLFCGQAVAGDELLKQADLAMYRAKGNGRNNVCFFDPAMETVIKARVELEDDLRRAVAAREFELHLQIQMEEDGGVVGAEALVRWRHPERGMVSPGAFIPVAEDTGLILPLGRWVLENACACLASWAHHPRLRELLIRPSHT